MKPIAPRSLVHCGSIQASALWFDISLLGESQARARVLALWRPGATVWFVKNGFLLQLPEPFRTDTRLSAGLPLTVSNTALLASPLTPAEFSQLSLTHNRVLLPHAGELIVSALENEVDPAAWLSLPDWRVVPVHPLAAPPSPPVVAVSPASNLDLRQQLLRTATPVALKQFNESLSPGPSTPSAPQKTASLLSRIRARVFNFLTRQLSSASHVHVPASPHRRILRDLLAHLFDLSGFNRLFGPLHARYLSQLLEFFDQGDLDAALRHAPALADLEKDPRSRVPLVGTLSPRKDLKINNQVAPASGALGLHPSLLDHLRRLYENAYQRLLREGRIQEAAFVLAELLKKTHQAVTLLEQHGHFRQAAELAEGRNLSPGLVVRLWCLAGDSARGFAIARRTGAFLIAINSLQAKRPDLADALRIAWAFSLAGAGNYIAAANVIRPVQAARPQLAEWLELASEIGGSVAGRAIALEASYFPENFSSILAKFNLHSQSETAAAFSSGFAQALEPNLKRTPQLTTLARECLRIFIASWASQTVQPNRDWLKQLRTAADEACLRADLPLGGINSTTFGKDSNDVVSQLKLDIPENDAGATPIFDVVLLPDNKLIVALGDAGALLLNRDGRRIAHFDQPVETLIPSTHGSRLIAIARSGSVSRLSRIDVIRRTCEFWCEAHITAFAPTFDGATWFVAGPQNLYAIEATHKRFEALWSVGDVGPVQAIVQSSKEMRFVAGGEVWFYELPQFTLRRRETIARKNVLIVRVHATSVGLVAVETQEHHPVWTYQTARDAEPQFAITRALDWQFGPHFDAVASRKPSGIEVAAFNLTLTRALLTLRGASQVRLRIQEDNLIAADNRGRVVVLNPRERAIIRNIRL